MLTETQVTINGERRCLSSGTTLLDVIRELGLVPDRVAIEFNREIVKREFWETTSIEAGAEIEIVQFVGGG